MSDDCNDPTKKIGVYTKTKDYRSNCEGCGRGYHGNRWDAHHVLPAVCFTRVTDYFVRECLDISKYNINEAASMCGLPKLTAFILALQNDRSIPYDESKEMTVTMRRWRTVKQYKNQSHMKIEFPGDLPVHNPCNWGHTEYNNEVYKHLDKKIFKKLRSKKKKNQHLEPEDIASKLKSACDHFWGKLKGRGSVPGGGGCVGIKENLRNRYDKAQDGWWKPMCMVDLPTEPSSPSLR